MLGGGLLIVLIGSLLGLGLVVGAIVLLVVGLVARRPQVGLTLSSIALGFSLLAILLSAMFWKVVLTGRSSTGDPIDRFGSDFPLTIVVLVEAFALCIALAGIGRQIARLRARA